MQLSAYVDWWAFCRNKCVDDGGGVAAFEPAVGGHGAVAGAVGAGVHHHDAVAGAEQQAGLTDAADAIVGDAVEDENPGAVGILWTNFPAAQRDAIWRGHVEVLTLRVKQRKV